MIPQYPSVGGEIPKEARNAIVAILTASNIPVTDAAAIDQVYSLYQQGQRVGAKQRRRRRRRNMALAFER